MLAELTAILYFLAVLGQLNVQSLFNKEFNTPLMIIYLLPVAGYYVVSGDFTSVWFSNQLSFFNDFISQYVYIYESKVFYIFLIGLMLYLYTVLITSVSLGISLNFDINNFEYVQFNKKQLLASQWASKANISSVKCYQN